MYQLVIIYFPTQNLLSDTECKICKYKSLIISINAFVLRCLKWLRGTVGRRKIGKNLQLTEQREQSQAGLNSAESWRKKTKLNMTAVKKRKCKHLQNRFSSSLHVHTFNADFCTLLHLLWSECICASIVKWTPKFGQIKHYCSRRFF